MAAVGGPLESITIAGRSFPVVADADANIDLGGFSAEMSPNGDGTARDLMSRKPWKVDGITIAIDPDREDLEYLQDKANSPGGRYPITITLVSGVTYQGRGKPTGDLKMGTKESTAGIELSGPGELAQQ